MVVTFLIPTYNRQESCQRLVDALQGYGNVVVLNDGCDYKINGCIQYFQSKNLGKPGYWCTVNALFKYRIESEYYFMINDDFLPVENMVERAITTWGSINDPRKICLNLYVDRVGEECWTHFKPVDKGNVWLTQWVDGFFMCEERFFTTLGLLPQMNYDWRKLPRQSSGVGSYISRRLYRLEYNLYQVKESLVTPQPEHFNSKMLNNVSNGTYRFCPRKRR